MNVNAPYDPMGVGPRPASPAVTGLAEWERTYSTFLHLSLLAALLGIPIIPCLIMWLMKREQSVFVDDHGREALNFQISLLIYSLACAPLAATVICIPLVVVVGIGVVVLGLVGMIQAASAAHHGRFYRYPMTIRLLH